MNNTAIEEVKRLVLLKFKANGKIQSFTMGMGTYFFKDIHNNIMHDFEYKALDKFIGEWDDILKITGEPMIIDRYGKIVTDW